MMLLNFIYVRISCQLHFLIITQRLQKKPSYMSLLADLYPKTEKPAHITTGRFSLLEFSSGFISILSGQIMYPDHSPVECSFYSWCHPAIIIYPISGYSNAPRPTCTHVSSLATSSLTAICVLYDVFVSVWPAAQEMFHVLKSCDSLSGRVGNSANCPQGLEQDMAVKTPD